MPDHPHVEAELCAQALGQLTGAVGAAVVDQHHLGAPGDEREHAGGMGQQQPQAVGLVVGRQHQAELVESRRLGKVSGRHAARIIPAARRPPAYPGVAGAARKWQ